MFFIRTRGTPGAPLTYVKRNREPVMTIVDLMRLTRFAAPLLATFCGPLPVAAETVVHLKLDRKIDGPAAPFFLAIDNGYFKAEGLDVTIDAATATDPQDAIKLLASGRYDLAVSDINQLITLRDQTASGAKAVFIVFDKPCAAIIARRSRGIAAPGDLAGKILGAPASEPASARWPIFAKLNQIDTSEITVENIGQPVRDPMLASGEVDAVTGCAFTSYIDLKARGVPKDDLVVWQMADYGVELYGDAIMASESFAAEKPDVVRGFLRAYVKALQETVRDPAAVLRRSDGAKKELELERLRMAIADDIV